MNYCAVFPSSSPDDDATASLTTVIVRHLNLLKIVRYLYNIKTNHMNYWTGLPLTAVGILLLRRRRNNEWRLGWELSRSHPGRFRWKSQVKYRLAFSHDTEERYASPLEDVSLSTLLYLLEKSKNVRIDILRLLLLKLWICSRMYSEKKIIYAFKYAWILNVNDFRIYENSFSKKNHLANKNY